LDSCTATNHYQLAEAGGALVDLAGHLEARGAGDEHARPRVLDRVARLLHPERGVDRDQGHA
jgi:hypothetical protein